jgi:hypothetical protein
VPQTPLNDDEPPTTACDTTTIDWLKNTQTSKGKGRLSHFDSRCDLSRLARTTPFVFFDLQWTDGCSC